MIPTFFLGGILMPSRFRFGPLVGCVGFVARARGEGTRRLCLRPGSG